MISNKLSFKTFLLAAIMYFATSSLIHKLARGADLQSATQPGTTSVVKTPLSVEELNHEVIQVLNDKKLESDARLTLLRELESQGANFDSYYGKDGHKKPLLWIVVREALRGQDPELKVLDFFLKDGVDVNAKEENPEGIRQMASLRLAIFPQPAAEDLESDIRVKVVRKLLRFGAYPAFAIPGPYQDLMQDEDTQQARVIQKLINQAMREGPIAALVRRDARLEEALEEAQQAGNPAQISNLKLSLDKVNRQKDRLASSLDLKDEEKIHKSVAAYINGLVEGNSKEASIEKLELISTTKPNGTTEEHVVGKVFLKTLQQIEKPKFLGGNSIAEYGDRKGWTVDFEFNLLTGDGCQKYEHNTEVAGVSHLKKIEFNSGTVRELILKEAPDFMSPIW